MRKTEIGKTLCGLAAPLAVAGILQLSEPAYAQTGCGAAMPDFQAALKANTADAISAYIDKHAPCFEAPARARLEALGGAPDVDAPTVAETGPAASPTEAAAEPVPAPAAGPASCDALADARSETWDQPLTIRVANDTGATLSVAWIDYDGVRKPAGELPAGEVFSGQTFATHPFEFTDANGTCMEIVRPETGMTDFTIAK